MISIITDSGSDITQDEAKKLNIKVLPICTTIDGKEYLDGIDLSHKEFYDLLESSKSFPKTTQVNVYKYQEAFREEIEKGNTVLCITIGSKLSGCYQSANIAMSSFSDKVFIIDSNNVSVGERNVVLLALSLINNGLTDINELVKKINEEIKDLCILASLDTLDYLQKGGRISKSKALLGNLFMIKPVVSVIDGKVELIGKAKGYKNAHNLLKKFVNDMGGIDFSRPLSLGYSGNDDTLLKKYIESSKELYEGNEEKLHTYSVGVAIGSHVGSGAIVISFFKKR